MEINHREEYLQEKEIPQLSYNLSRIAYLINDKIHQFTFKSELSRHCNTHNVIIGWDTNCIKNFIKRNIGININSINNWTNIYTNGNRYNVFHNITNAKSILRESLSINIFVLISALQYGQAQNQLAKCGLKDIANKTDNLYIVVQDFQEIINSQVICDIIPKLREMELNLALQTKYNIMVMHENPIYNIVALETQNRRETDIIVQKDEMSILKSLQKSSFRFLCSSPAVEKNVISIIQSLK